MMRVLVLAVLVLPNAALAQARDSVPLAELHARVLRADPREAQRTLLASQARLRLANIGAEQRPTLGLEGVAQYQSDVARVPVALPGIVPPPHDTYDARVAATQRLYDPAIGARRALERSQLGQSLSRLDVSLFDLRRQLNDAFFAALRAQVQGQELVASVSDLEAQLRVADARVREGAALGSEAFALRAELLRRRQLLAEADASRRASLEILGQLAGVSLDSATVLVTPDLAGLVNSARATLAAARQRPEFDHFARSRDVLASQQRVRRAQELPRVSAFGRAGYGRPGLNPLNAEFDSYWLAGVQLQWFPFTWGASTRDREVLALQQRILETEERAFADALQRAVAHDLATVDRLEASVAADDEIIALRERIASETRARFREGAVTSAEYVDRQTDVLSARLNRAIHRAELAQSRARVLTTLGIRIQ